MQCPMLLGQRCIREGDSCVVRFRRVHVVYHFCMENRLSKILFSNPFRKNAEVMNLKNPDLDLIPSILLECGYFGFMIRLWISPKNATLKIVYRARNTHL